MKSDGRQWLEISIKEVINLKNVSYTINLGGLPVLLTIIFVVLKLMGYIAWSWLWVFSPIIFTVGMSVAITIIVVFVFVLSVISASLYNRR